MAKSEVDVISLEWATTPSRDRISATLVCNYLRLQGLTVKEASVYDGYQAIYEAKPKLLFITNTVGAVENLELMRYAKQRNILGVSLVSEGNLQGDAAYQSEMIWGWNKSRHLYEDINMQWSGFARDATVALHPELKGRIKVSGGVGFDNYKIADAKNVKEKILAKYRKNGYSKIVGVGCWDFGIFYSEDTRYEIFDRLYSDDQKKRFIRDSFAFDEILTQLATRNRDVLFLLKQHPGVQLGLMASGIEQVAGLDNVLVLKNEEPILTCIQASDLWIVYESTTALEAWLLGKVTCLLNPSGRDFPRDRLNEGSPAFATSEQLQQVINSVFSGAVIPEFLQREGNREKIIKEVIQWDDGLNHVRAGNEIIKLLQMNPGVNWRGESRREYVARLIQHAKWLFRPYVRWDEGYKKSAANRFNFSMDMLSKYGAAKLQEQLNFYRDKKLSLDD